MASHLSVTIEGESPTVHPQAWIAPTASLIGKVTVAAQASVWYATVIRGDRDTIAIGARSNIQDGCVLHTDPGIPVAMGEGVSVGHRAVVHGSTIEDDVLVGMGAVLLNHSHVGAGSLIAAGAVVLEGTEIPPGSLVAGVPGKVRRELTDKERAGIGRNAETYLEVTALHAKATG
jgi:carbonic anhydrase/acetyltransferase-like protein (isoleucine patch superfamily)